MGSLEAAIRPLTREERKAYASAVITATTICRPMRDGVVSLRPYFDATADTAYTDRYSRMGLSPWFFTLTKTQQATVLLHECMHPLNGHFHRGEALEGVFTPLMNVAGDFEINCGLRTLPGADLKYGILPDRGIYAFAPNLSMEKYVHLLKEEERRQKKKKQEERKNCPQCREEDEKRQQEQQQGSSGKKGDEESSEQQQSSSNGGGESPQDSPTDASQENQGGGTSPGEDSPQEGSSSDEEGGTSSGSSSSEQQGEGSQGSSSESGGKRSNPADGCPHKNQGGSGQGSPQGKGKGEPGEGDPARPCDTPSEARSEAADEAGIERASESEQNITRKNVMARVSDALNEARAAGKGEGNTFLQMVLQQMSPPKVPWQSILTRVTSRACERIIRGRSDYTFRRPNRRMSGAGDFIYPGMVKYSPKIAMGIDTSGSMGEEDHMTTLSEAEGIFKALARSRDSFFAFCVDYDVKTMKPVKAVKDINLEGGGGTDMSKALDFICNLPAKERPDIFVLATDGYTPWDVYLKALEKLRALGIVHILLITTHQGYVESPKELTRHATVLDISPDPNKR